MRWSLKLKRSVRGLVNARLAETFHGGLMRALIPLRRNCEARDAYERRRELLLSGLGWEPSAQICELPARILSS
jgi:hypothetical protein